MKTVCIIGLGIGSLYVRAATALGYNIVTVDPNPELNADYTDISELPIDIKFDMAIICVPNYLHETIAKAVVSHTSRIVIEKPGFESLERWKEFQKNHKAKIFMVKNNMYRVDFYHNVSFIQEFHDIESIKVLWVNQDRVPGAGGWFTNKQLSYGGVSRDLMPHALSVVQAILRKPNIDSNFTAVNEQVYSLDQVSSNEWGKANPNGIYDVDDHAYVLADVDGIKVECATAWKHDNIKRNYVEWQVKFNNNTKLTYTAGLCPEEAYVDMLDAYMLMTDKKYQEYISYDNAIHNILDNFKTGNCKQLINDIIHED